MIKSMTGFGRATITCADKVFAAEVRSLNSKLLDLNMRIAPSLREKETEFRNKVTTVAERGKVDMALYSENNPEALVAMINKPLAKMYHQELQKLARELKQPESDLLSIVLKMPEVIKAQKETVSPSAEEWKAAKTVLEKALNEFDSFRKKEGSVLEAELKKRIGIILSMLKKIEPLDKRRFVNLSNKIKKSLRDHLRKEKIDENRFEQELIYYFEKLDISEEKLRLKTHCDYFLQTMKEEASGRKLSFISQEIGREINTIGSKANDADMQKFVVQMKDELEKIKEQLMNVL